MRTVNTIVISSDQDTVFRTASDILGWPRMLPHYRWVRHIGGNRDWTVLEMAAWRGVIPIKWTSLTQIDQEERRIYFRHIGGLTRGMEVVWLFRQAGDKTEVSIVHELSRMKVPIVRSKPGKLVTGKFFVECVADRTLRSMKRWIEEQS
jgi:ribosome-associated toxin RatA of RatAB toxin-antitoxin module